MSKLTSMKNIGKTISDKLTAVGITTPEQLCQTGSRNAFLLLKERYPEVCLVHLYTLESAIEDIDMACLSQDVKDELKRFSDAQKKSR